VCTFSTLLSTRRRGQSRKRDRRRTWRWEQKGMMWWSEDDEERRGRGRREGGRIEFMSEHCVADMRCQRGTLRKSVCRSRIPLCNYQVGYRRLRREI